MEYFVLVSTLISLFFGFLFFVDKIAAFDVISKSILVILTMIIIIGANVFVVIMIIYDVFVRRKKERKRAKNKRKEREEIRRKARKRREYEDKYGIVITNEIERAKDDKLLEYDFKIIESPSDSEEDELSTINDIFDDLISIKRFYKKIWIAKKKGKKFSVKIIKGADKLTNRNSSKNLEKLSTFINVESTKEMKDESLKLEKKTDSKVKRLIVSSKSSKETNITLSIEDLDEEIEMRDFDLKEK